MRKVFFGPVPQPSTLAAREFMGEHPDATPNEIRAHLTGAGFRRGKDFSENLISSTRTWLKQHGSGDSKAAVPASKKGKKRSSSKVSISSNGQSHKSPLTTEEFLDDMVRGAAHGTRLDVALAGAAGQNVSTRASILDNLKIVDRFIDQQGGEEKVLKAMAQLRDLNNASPLALPANE